VFWIYLKAYKAKMKQSDLMAWIQGMYIAKAISACFDKDYPYPCKPLGFFDESSDLEENNLSLEKDQTEPENINKSLIDAQMLQVQSYFKNKSK
jgi:hypothetical protein